jgi:hypothetical protein
VSLEKSITEEKSDLRVAFTVAAVVIGSLVSTLYDIGRTPAYPAARGGIVVLGLVLALIVWRAYQLTGSLRKEKMETS